MHGRVICFNLIVPIEVLSYSKKKVRENTLSTLVIMGDEFGEALVNFLPLLRIPSRSDFIHTGFSLARVPLRP